VTGIERPSRDVLAMMKTVIVLAHRLGRRVRTASVVISGIDVLQRVFGLRVVRSSELERGVDDLVACASNEGELVVASARRSRRRTIGSFCAASSGSSFERRPEGRR